MSKADEMNKKLEEAIERMRRDYELAKSEDSIDIDIFTEDIKTVLDYIENSISKETIKEKIEEIQNQYKEELEKNSTKAFILKCQIEILKELLEGK